MGGEGGPGFAELFAALPVAALAVSPEGRIAHANVACEQLLNLSERSMAGAMLDAVLTPPADPHQQDGHGFAAFDAEITVARGPRLRADFAQATVPGHPGWRTITLHDATPSRRFGQVGERAGGARAAIGAAAMLAHEIRNPLSGIRGAAQLLADGDGAADLTRLIVTEVDRIAALIDRMQRFTDDRPLPVGPENIYPLLDHARRLALAGFARGVTIEERFDPSLPPALIDRDATTQIVLNLIKNAAEATAGQADRRIVLTTSYRHGLSVSAAPGRPRQPLPIEIAIHDNGPGAADDIAEHLFEPFVSGRAGGQGLGLALVDKLVRDMGGIVRYARDGDPAMTVFRVLLPRATA